MSVTLMMYRGERGRLKSADPFQAVEFLASTINRDARGSGGCSGFTWYWLVGRLMALCHRQIERYPEDADLWFERYKALRAIR